MNFKSPAAYKSWLAYGHVSGEFAKTPGHQKVAIKGKAHKVQHGDGGGLDDPQPSAKGFALFPSLYGQVDWATRNSLPEGVQSLGSRNWIESMKVAHNINKRIRNKEVGYTADGTPIDYSQYAKVSPRFFYSKDDMKSIKFTNGGTLPPPDPYADQLSDYQYFYDIFHGTRPPGATVVNPADADWKSWEKSRTGLELDKLLKSADGNSFYPLYKKPTPPTPNGGTAPIMPPASIEEGLVPIEPEPEYAFRGVTQILRDEQGNYLNQRELSADKVKEMYKQGVNDPAIAPYWTSEYNAPGGERVAGNQGTLFNIPRTMNVRQFAMGGPMDQLTQFTEGGTHEENPMGGIPQGMSPDGKINLVEEGETKHNSENYIFSDSLKIDKSIAKEFNLPASMVDKTFAEASEKANRPNSRRENDSIEQKAIKRDLDNLMAAQEAFKAKEVEEKVMELQALAPEMFAAPQGGLPPMTPEMNTFMCGGKKYEFGGNIKNPELMTKIGQGFQAASPFLNVIPGVGQVASLAAAGIGTGLTMAGKAGMEYQNKLAAETEAAKMQGLAADQAMGMPVVNRYGGNIYALGGPIIGPTSQSQNLANQNFVADYPSPYIGLAPLAGGQYGKDYLLKHEKNSQNYFDALQNKEGITPQELEDFVTEQEDQYFKDKTSVSFDLGGEMELEDALMMDLENEEARLSDNGGPFSNIEGDPGLQNAVNMTGDYSWNNPNLPVNPYPNPVQYTVDPYLSALQRADETLKDKNLNLEMNQTLGQAIGMGIPAAYNIGMGLFGKVDQMDPNEFKIKADIKPYEYNIQPVLRQADQTFAQAQEAVKNAAPSAGAYLSNMSQMANQRNRAYSEIYGDKYNKDAAVAMQAELANKNIEAQNLQGQMAIRDYNAKAKAAKNAMLAAGLGQAGQLAQNAAQRDIEATYMKAIAPDFASTFKYNTIFEQAKENLKNKKNKSA